jgi:hypothetical protein
MTVTTEMVVAVKSLLSMTGSFDEVDATIARYVAAVEDYMIGAGVSEAVIEAHPGAVARGVDDMYTNNSGGADFSAMFKNMVTQLAMRS